MFILIHEGLMYCPKINFMIFMSIKSNNNVILTYFKSVPESCCDPHPLGPCNNQEMAGLSPFANGKVKTATVFEKG